MTSHITLAFSNKKIKRSNTFVVKQKRDLIQWNNNYLNHNSSYFYMLTRPIIFSLPSLSHQLLFNFSYNVHVLQNLSPKNYHIINNVFYPFPSVLGSIAIYSTHPSIHYNQHHNSLQLFHIQLLLHFSCICSFRSTKGIHEAKRLITWFISHSFY